MIKDFFKGLLAGLFIGAIGQVAIGLLNLFTNGIDFPKKP